MAQGKNPVELTWIRDQVQAGEYEFSEHAERERQADRMPISDVERALFSADMLEEYPDDSRGPSCLILGYGATGYPVHVVCGRSPKGTLRLITVYVPSLPKWLDARTRAGR